MARGRLTCVRIVAGPELVPELAVSQHQAHPDAFFGPRRRNCVEDGAANPGNEEDGIQRRVRRGPFSVVLVVTPTLRVWVSLPQRRAVAAHALREVRSAGRKLRLTVVLSNSAKLR